MKETVVQMVKELVGENGNLYFATSLLVKINPHSWPIQIWGISVKDGRIALMDGFQIWNELEDTDDNYRRVLSTLYQRIQVIYKQVKTVA